LVLGLPLKPLCREECLGFCPQCGKNRNEGPCGCPTAGAHAGLASLAAIRDKLPQS
jgi:uncharacterized protein